MKTFCNSYSLKVLSKQPTWDNKFWENYLRGFGSNKQDPIFQKHMCYREKIMGFPQRNYRDFKKFNNQKFVNFLQSLLFDPQYWLQHSLSWCIFFQLCQKVFDNHAPQKKKYIRENHKPFMKKRLSKAITLWTPSRNKCLKNATDENMYIYTKQCNMFASIVSLLILYES